MLDSWIVSVSYDGNGAAGPPPEYTRAWAGNPGRRMAESPGRVCAYSDEHQCI